MRPGVLLLRGNLEWGAVFVSNLSRDCLSALERDPRTSLALYGNEATVEPFALRTLNGTDDLNPRFPESRSPLPCHERIRIEHAKDDVLYSTLNNDVCAWRRFPFVTTWFQIDIENILLSHRTS